MVRLVTLLFVIGVANARDLVLLERALSGRDVEGTATVTDEGELTSFGRAEILKAHNEARSSVSPTASNMVDLVCTTYI